MSQQEFEQVHRVQMSWRSTQYGVLVAFLSSQKGVRYV